MSDFSWRLEIHEFMSWSLTLGKENLSKSSSDAYCKPWEKGDSFTSIISENPPQSPLPRASAERGIWTEPSTASWGHMAR